MAVKSMVVYAIVRAVLSIVHGQYLVILAHVLPWLRHAPPPRQFRLDATIRGDRRSKYFKQALLSGACPFASKMEAPDLANDDSVQRGL